MSDPFIGEIRLFAGDFAPVGWATCDGQLFPIHKWAALFSILGTTYGGNGQTQFALPNLNGRAALGAGQGPGLSEYLPGQTGGMEAVTLIESELPAHDHSVMTASGDPAESNDPTNFAIARSSLFVYAPAANFVQGAVQELAPNGSSFPHNNIMPYLTLTYIIALQGVFPPRP